MFFSLRANLLMRLGQSVAVGEGQSVGRLCWLPLEVVQVLCNAQQCAQFGNRWEKANSAGIESAKNKQKLL